MQILKHLTVVAVFLILLFAVARISSTTLIDPSQENSNAKEMGTEDRSVHEQTEPKLKKISGSDSERAETQSKPSTSIAGPSSFSSIPVATAINARTALINILCISKDQDKLPSIVGSGVVVSESGVAITNAHIAQYMLFESVGLTECVVRHGAPATTKYTPTLLYLPQMWVQENKSKIGDSEPYGTGEHDYAFFTLKSIGEKQESFDYLNLDISSSLGTPEEILLNEGVDVHVVGYPAEFFSSKQILNNLFPLSANTKIEKLFTFGENTLDLISLGSSIVSQRGASGGAVVGVDGKLNALVVTTSDEDAIQSRILRAITLGHVDRSLQTHGREGILQLISGDVRRKSDLFVKNEVPNLADTLSKFLD